MNSLFSSVKNYLSLVKFSHTIFAMPFALIGYALAVAKPEYDFSIRLLLLIILCMIFARNAAMGFNRLADKKFDALNPRTKNREIPSGIIGTRAAAIFVIINVIFFIITTCVHKPADFFSFTCCLTGYPWVQPDKKIYFTLPFYTWFRAQSGSGRRIYIINRRHSIFLPLIYSFIVLTWVSGFDIIYALQDDEFDKSNNLHSLPSVTGRKNAIAISIIVHIITFILVIIAGITGEGGYLFWTGASLFSIFLIYQHLIVKHNDLSRVTLAFSTTNGIASILFAVFVILDLLFRYQ